MENLTEENYEEYCYTEADQISGEPELILNKGRFSHNNRIKVICKKSIEKLEFKLKIFDSKSSEKIIYFQDIGVEIKIKINGKIIAEIVKNGDKKEFKLSIVEKNESNSYQILGLKYLEKNNHLIDTVAMENNSIYKHFSINGLNPELELFFNEKNLKINKFEKIYLNGIDVCSSDKKCLIDVLEMSFSLDKLGFAKKFNINDLRSNSGSIKLSTCHVESIVVKNININEDFFIGNPSRNIKLVNGKIKGDFYLHSQGLKNLESIEIKSLNKLLKKYHLLSWIKIWFKSPNKKAYKTYYEAYEELNKKGHKREAGMFFDIYNRSKFKALDFVYSFFSGSGTSLCRPIIMLMLFWLAYFFIYDWPSSLKVFLPFTYFIKKTPYFMNSSSALLSAFFSIVIYIALFFIGQALRWKFKKA